MLSRRWGKPHPTSSADGLVGAGAATVAETRTATPLPRRAKPAAGEGWGGGSDICRYTKSGLKYRPFTYTNPATLYVNHQTAPSPMGEGWDSDTIPEMRFPVFTFVILSCNRYVSSPWGNGTARIAGKLGWGQQTIRVSDKRHIPFTYISSTQV